MTALRFGRSRRRSIPGQVPAGTPAAREGFDMRRHGWALCLGALLTGSAAAQPPASEERFPPAPDLPGEVVGQLPAPRAATTPADPKDAKPVAPAAAPLPDTVLAPYTSTATTTVAPVPAVPPAAPCPPVAGGPSGKKGCNIGFWDVKDWLCFRSKSRQSGHFVTPYRPPLYTWFPCEPRQGACGAGPLVGGPGCAGPVPGALAPEGTLPTPGSADAMAPAVPLGGGTAVGKCLDAEVLTSFQPIGPGLGFTPGGAPMANPTTQIKPTTFKPK